MYHTLATEITNADTDPNVRCILIKANGDMFTAGNDLADFAAIGNATAAPKPEDANPLLPALARARTPIIAAVNGRAVGGRCNHAAPLRYGLCRGRRVAHCSVRQPRVGPRGGLESVMPLRIGHVRAFEMFVLGEPVNAGKSS